MLAQPVDLVDVDPRQLWASQPWVVRHHAAYYRTGEWERTGRTSADHWVELNQFPVVVERRGRSIIVAGHHRATAALIDGRPLRVRVAARGGRVAVTPLLFVDASGGEEPDRALALDRGGPASGWSARSRWPATCCDPWACRPTTRAGASRRRDVAAR